MSEFIEIKINAHDFDKKLETKGSQVGKIVEDGVQDMLLTVQGEVRFVTHRGNHCSGKGGTTKSAVKQKLGNAGGVVYVDEHIAPWVRWYIDGRGPVVAKGKKHGGADYLRFCAGGKVIYRKRVKAWKGHDIMKEGLERSQPILKQKADELGKELRKL